MLFLVSFKKQDTESVDLQSNVNETDEFGGYDVLVDLTTQIQNENPTWSDEQVMAELERIVLTKSYSGPLISMKELKVILSKGLFAVFKVNNLKTEAENKANQYYGSTGTLYQGDGDAFRHVYFSALLYRDFDKQFSIDLLTAHEENVEDLTDKNMDLHNNSRGISLLEVWRDRLNDISLDQFICHCVSYGYFYNIVEILTKNNVLNFTTMGAGNKEWLDRTINSLELDKEAMIHINPNDFLWFSFDSKFTHGDYSIESLGNSDLYIDKHSSYDQLSNIIMSDDDSGENYNFKLYFSSEYNEKHYFKVYAIDRDENCDINIICKSVSTSVMPPTYTRRDKNTHFKFYNGVRTVERHVVRAGSGQLTSCIYCGEMLDLRIHGPFIVEGPILAPKKDILYVKELEKWKNERLNYEEN